MDIEEYPAVRDWLLPFKEKLEARATQQEWWELQQAQLAYQPKFDTRKISYPHFQNARMFTIEETGAYSNDKSYFIPNAANDLLGLLNSQLAWSFFTSISPAVRNGWHEFRVQYIERLPIPDADEVLNAVGEVAGIATSKARDRLTIETKFKHRILTDLVFPNAAISRKLMKFHDLSFPEFRAELKRALRAEIPVKERSQWEELHKEASAQVKRLTSEIGAAEREIDRLVQEAFELTPEEVVLLEKSLDVVA